MRESFIQGHHGVAVFFDFEKAYDTTWKYGIMKDLHSAGLRGRLPEFISGFLNDRHFRVQIEALLSDEFEQEMGVPQGCILSVTLFCLKINSIVKTLLPDIECSLYRRCSCNTSDVLICKMFRRRKKHFFMNDFYQINLCVVS